MAKKVIVWSEIAKLQFANVLEYYVERYGNPNYSLKLLNEVEDLILLSLYEPRQRYAIIQFVEEVTNGRVLLGAGTLYGALSSLEEKGWIKLQSTESTSRKKVYLITPSGKEAVQTEIDRLHQLIDLAERISKEI